MEKGLKPPFIPPKNLMMSDAELKKMETSNKSVNDEINVNI